MTRVVKIRRECTGGKGERHLDGPWRPTCSLPTPITVIQSAPIGSQPSCGQQGDDQSNSCPPTPQQTKMDKWISAPPRLARAATPFRRHDQSKQPVGDKPHLPPRGGGKRQASRWSRHHPRAQKWEKLDEIAEGGKENATLTAKFFGPVPRPHQSPSSGVRGGAPVLPGGGCREA